MRWFFIDKLIHIEKGRTASALKNITLGEEYLHDLYPGLPIMPNSLVIESMAQTAGILIGYTFDFRYPVILAKVVTAMFNGFARPGDQLEIKAVLKEAREGVFRVEGKVTIAGRQFASGRLMFANYGEPVSRDKNFVFNEMFLSFLNLNGVSDYGG